jgi:hypothetical protein
MSVPVFVVCRDRLTPLLQLLAWLERVGLDEVYLLDNDSTYPPLRAFYESCGPRVIRLGRNVGKLALFTTPGMLDQFAGMRPFVCTDPDIVPVERCPADAIERFQTLLDAHEEVVKVGFGLVIDDLPDHYPFKKQVIAWEKRWWEDEIEPGVFRAPIDTTFALYRAGTREYSLDALRTGEPYVARHTTWYTDLTRLSEEDELYANDDASTTQHWGRLTLNAHVAHYTSMRGKAARLRDRVRGRVGALQRR